MSAVVSVPKTWDQQIEFRRKSTCAANKSNEEPVKYKSDVEISREKAWERRRMMKMYSEMQCAETDSMMKSLTEDDFDELQGCIDLGFRFCNEEDPQLRSTLPALEICYAVNRQLQDIHLSSPESSPCSWRVSNPGDELQDVKERLRHWARAVACLSKQSGFC